MTHTDMEGISIDLETKDVENNEKLLAVRKEYEKHF
jgi:hypothetical protein